MRRTASRAGRSVLRPATRHRSSTTPTSDACSSPCGRTRRRRVRCATSTRGWGAANVGEPDQLLAAATPYLRMLSTLVGGWLLGVEALAASRAAPDDFHAAKIATARFYANHLLPSVDGLLATVTAGKIDL